MKKLFVLLIAPLAIFSALQAQTTQQQADAIALERMDAETRPYGLYSKEGLQPAGTTIETSHGEVIELDYESWVYYVLYTDNPQGRYLIVNEDNGNLLEVNVKDDEGPSDLEEWKHIFVPNTGVWEYAQHLPSISDTITLFFNHRENEVYVKTNYNEMSNHYYLFDDGDTLIISGDSLILKKYYHFSGDPVHFIRQNLSNNKMYLKYEGIVVGIVVTNYLFNRKKNQQ